MSEPSFGTRQDALRALDAARPYIARLDTSRDGEDLAADLIESWSAVEAALRALVGTGGAVLGGSALIREARQRQILSFEQANALAEFSAAQERAHDVGYRPTSTDLAAAKDGFLKLESGLTRSASAIPAPEPPMEAMSTAGLRTTPLGEPMPVAPSDGRPHALWFTIGAVLVLALIGFGVWGYRRGGLNEALQRGVEDYREGRREAAAGEFTKAARDNPNDALPHVYLARMAREVGNLDVARNEADAAIRADPNNALGHREMASYLLTVGNYSLAAKFFVNAIQHDPSDRIAMGWLGCALAKQGRMSEATSWFNRAGQGPWTSCTPAGPPGAAPPGAAAPPRP